MVSLALIPTTCLACSETKRPSFLSNRKVFLQAPHRKIEVTRLRWMRKSLNPQARVPTRGAYPALQKGQLDRVCGCRTVCDGSSGDVEDASTSVPSASSRSCTGAGRGGASLPRPPAPLQHGPHRPRDAGQRRRGRLAAEVLQQCDNDRRLDHQRGGLVGVDRSRSRNGSSRYGARRRRAADLRPR